MRVEMTSPNPQEGGKEQGFLPESPSADAGPSPRSHEAPRFGGWLPIETAPMDGTRFLALQGSEIWRAYGQINERTGAPYFVRRAHERRQERTYRHVPVEIDGVMADRRVLTHEGPDNYEFNWVVWSRGFDFKPTHWMPIPEPPAAGDRATSRDEGGLRDEPENPTLQATGGENGR